jgi:hypothetical protein
MLADKHEGQLSTLSSSSALNEYRMNGALSPRQGVTYVEVFSGIARSLFEILHPLQAGAGRTLCNRHWHRARIMLMPILLK